MTDTAQSINWWTDVGVPLGAALIGGASALIGGWFGAKWAAKEQGKFARQMEAERRRDRLQSDAILQLDEILQRLEYRARASEEQWERTPASMSSNWNEELTRPLGEFVVDWPAVQPRVTDERIRSEIDLFLSVARVEEINAVQEARHQQQDQVSIDAARKVNREILWAAEGLRTVLNDAL